MSPYTYAWDICMTAFEIPIGTLSLYNAVWYLAI